MTTSGLWAAARRQAELAALGPSLDDVTIPQPTPLAPAQQRLWQLDRLHPGRTTQNLHLAYRLRGELDEPRLTRALQTIWARHDGLRARVDVIEGLPTLGPHDAGGWAPTSGMAAGWDDAVGQAVAIAQAPYDLTVDPLFRVALLRLGDQDHLLLVAAHHIVFDAWSRDVLHRELAALYAGPSLVLAEPGTSYRQYAAWMNARLADAEVRQPLQAWWDGHLAGRPAPATLTEAGRPPMQTGPGPRRRHVAAIDGELVAEVRALGAATGSSLAGTLFAGFCDLLAGRGQLDTVVFSPASGRLHGRLHDLIGYFVSMQPLRAEVRGLADVAGLVRRGSDALSGAGAHQGLSDAELATRYGAFAGRPPLMFGVQNTAATPLVLDGLEVEPVHLEAGQADFDTYVNLEPGANGAMTCLVDFDGDRHTHAWAASLAVDFTTALQGLVTGRTWSVGLPTSDVMPGVSSAVADGRRGTPVDAADPLRVHVAALLGVDELDEGASLLELGLDSLKLIALAERLERDLGLRLSLSTLVDAPSLRVLGEQLVSPSAADEPRVVFHI
jgi:aryl carrier-like protein